MKMSKGLKNSPYNHIKSQVLAAEENKILISIKQSHVCSDSNACDAIELEFSISATGFGSSGLVMFSIIISEGIETSGSGSISITFMVLFA